MRSARHRGMITIGFAASLALAAAAGIGRDGRGGGARDKRRGGANTGNGGAGERAPAAPVAPAPTPAAPHALPSGVALQDLPAGVTREIPLVDGHKFVKFDDRIV